MARHGMAWHGMAVMLYMACLAYASFYLPEYPKAQSNQDLDLLMWRGSALSGPTPAWPPAPCACLFLEVETNVPLTHRALRDDPFARAGRGRGLLHGRRPHVRRGAARGRRLRGAFLWHPRPCHLPGGWYAWASLP